jgi:TonB family protein
LGDTISTLYYNKFCSNKSDKLKKFYKESEPIYSSIIKSKPNPNAYLDLAIAKINLEDKCAFCENLENNSLSNIQAIQDLIEKKCCKTQMILIDSLQNGNRIYNTIFTETYNSKRKYIYLETNSYNITTFSYSTSEIQTGRIMKINVNNLLEDTIEYTLNIDTFKLGSKDKSLYIHKIIKVKKPEPILTIVELMPGFDGGEEALYKWLGENIKYPQEAKETGIMGTVIVTFVVEKDGSLTGFHVLKDIGGGCSKEALRVVKAMPKWIPGKQNGVPVRVQFNLPIRFTLE